MFSITSPHIINFNIIIERRRSSFTKPLNIYNVSQCSHCSYTMQWRRKKFTNYENHVNGNRLMFIWIERKFLFLRKHTQRIFNFSFRSLSFCIQATRDSHVLGIEYIFELSFFFVKIDNDTYLSDFYYDTSTQSTDSF